MRDLRCFDRGLVSEKCDDEPKEPNPATEEKGIDEAREGRKTFLLLAR